MCRVQKKKRIRKLCERGGGSHWSFSGNCKGWESVQRKLSTQMTTSSKVSLQNQRTNRDFQGKYTLRDFVTTQPTLQKALEESFVAKRKINTALNAQEGIIH